MLGKILNAVKSHLLRRLTSVTIESSIHPTASIDMFVELIHVSIGRYSTVSKGCTIRGPVEIGSFSQIGPNVGVFAKDHPLETVSIYVGRGLAQGARKSLQLPSTVIIKNDVWIGCAAVITKGVTIGDGAVVAAGAVVTTDIPDFEIWGGVPARKIGMREFASKNYRCSKHLCEWWLLDDAELLEFFKTTDKSFV